MSLIYEKYIGGERDRFKSYEDYTKNFKITYNEDFNFAYDVMDELAKKKPEKTAMLWVSSTGEEKNITFSEMKRMSDKAANYFKSLGIKKGDRVLLVLKRSYHFWYCMLGLHKLGAVSVSGTHLLTAKDYIYRCQSAEIKMAVIIGQNDCTKHFDEAESQCLTVELKAVVGNANNDNNTTNTGKSWLDFDAGLAAADENWIRPSGTEGINAKDELLLAFSSGTTGYPKMITHDHTYPLGHIGTALFWHRVGEDGLHFTISDTGWAKSLWGKMYGQWLGESGIFTYDFDKFNAADIMEKIEKYKITTFCVPPTMFRFMLNEDAEKYDLSCIKHCCTAGEALSPDIFNKWKELTGLSIYEGFGQTETTVCCAIVKQYTAPRIGSMGLPVAGYDIRILDDDMNEVAPGVTGEMCIPATLSNKPVGLFNGYYKDTEATEKAFRGGFYHTGDTAYKDEQGYIWYVGRNDDIIKSSGYRIGPFEVESVLLEHAAVLECAVTGVPDPIRGFNVKATIVLRKGFEASDGLVKEIQNFVKKTTAPYKYPRIVEFVDELPKTISGKVRRVEIRNADKK